MPALPVVAALGAGLVACQTTPRPLGEALVVVSTDVEVPRYVGRVRVDVHASDGRLLQTRELPTPSALDWPLSFSVVSDAEDRAASLLLRVRGYPDGHTEPRAASGAPAAQWSEPASYDTLADVCAHAPTLAIGDVATLRRGPRASTNVRPNGAACAAPTVSGSVAARVEIARAGQYQFDVLDVIPAGRGGSTTLSLRADCNDEASQIACTDAPLPRQRLVVELSPGTYYLVTGGADPAPADVTLRASVPNPLVSVDGGASAASAAELEPSPGVTIDRLVPLRLEPGRRGTVQVELHGACFGARAKLGDRASCLDDGTVTPRPDVVPDGALTRAGGATPGSWAEGAPRPCAIAPRAGGPLGDDEVCIPGGAFALGDRLALSDGALRSHPERTRVVEPFVMDKYELSVARYRDALRRGFVPPEPVVVNVGALADVGPGCTWNVAASGFEPAPGVEREQLPLTCVPWATARALCKFLGGDLPHEDQWEYAATAAGKDRETSYPWGDALPTCDGLFFGRFAAAGNAPCPGASIGPARVDDPAWASSDRTPLGVVGLGGNVQEWLLDAFVPYDHPAWDQAGLRAPLAWQERAPLRGTRGTSWADLTDLATATVRNAQSPAFGYGNVGLRCVRGAR